MLLEPMHVGLGVRSRVSLGPLLYIRPRLPNLSSISFYYYFGGFFRSPLRVFLGNFIWIHHKQIIFGII